MSTWFGDQVFSVGIMGGGRGGLGLLKFFSNNPVTKVAFVVDADPAAPGILEAQAQGIATFLAVASALRGPLPDFLFDATGDEEVAGSVRERLAGSGTTLVAATTCRMLVEVLQLNARAVRDDIGVIVGAIQRDLDQSLDTSTTVVSEIDSIMSTMQMLALNAGIEAAKAGVHGRGFSVVAEHLGKSAEAVRNLTFVINQVNQNIIQVSRQSSSVLEKLGG